MKHLAILLLFLLPNLGFAQTQAPLLYHFNDLNITPSFAFNGRYSETWGFVYDNIEYGVIGTTDGMRLFDLSNVTTTGIVPDPIKIFGASSGGNIIHRDMKEWNGYLYAVCDEGSATLQIVDCHNLPTSVEVVYNSNEFVSTSHNVFLDTSQARLYLLGASGGMTMLDISNPILPTLLASYPNTNYYLPYVHDAYIHNNIGIMNCGGDGLWVVDFSNPSAPATLGTMTNYPGAGYNHSGWMTDDGRYYALCDETHGSPVKMIDFKDFTDMGVVSSMNAASFSSQIPHNVLINKNLLYASYYYDGLQVFDISDPLSPQRVQYYDTYNGANQASYAGAWGVNPNLPSGISLIGDMNTGFWVFGPQPQPADFQLRTNHPFLMICEGQEAEMELTAGSSFNSTGMAPIVTGLSTGAVANFPNNVQAGSKFTVKIANLSAGEHVINCSITDGSKTGAALVHVFVKNTSSSPSLIQPANGAVNQAIFPALKWNAVAGANKYYIEVSTVGGANFDQNIFYTATKPGISMLLNSAGLQYGATYYWRVYTQNYCGNAYSEIFSFTIKTLVNTVDLGENSLKIYPSPAINQLNLEFEAALIGETQIELWNLAGQRVFETLLPNASKNTLVPVGNLPDGSYILKIKNGDIVGQTTVVKTGN
jgi:choice-of-anchor B domain-containing protein